MRYNKLAVVLRILGPGAAAGWRSERGRGRSTMGDTLKLPSGVTLAGRA